MSSPRQPELSVGPASCATGNKYERQTDIARLPGAHGLAFIRYYNSASPYNQRLGHNWRTNYSVHLKHRAHDSIALWQADGRRIDFHPTGKDHYRASAYADGTLERTASGYAWHWRQGTTLDLGAHGRLQAIHYADHTSTQLTYNPAGRLTHVTDPQGRSLTLTYTRDGHLARVTGPAGGATTYSYDGHTNLDQVTGPTGIIRRYHYDDPRDVHHLTGISRAQRDPTIRPQSNTNIRLAVYNPNSHSPKFTRIATWAYDDQGRAVLSEHANGADQTTLDFKKHKTLVTRAGQGTSVYHTAKKQGVPIVTAVDGPGCSSCGGGNTRYSYTDNLRLKQVHFADGSTAYYQYDAQGRLTSAGTVDAADHQHKRADLAYLGDTTHVARLTSPSVNPDQPRVMTFEYNKHGRLTRLAQEGYAPQPNGGYKPIERHKTFGYDAHDRLNVIHGPRGTTRYQWDAHGALKRFTTPNGRQTTILARSARGRPTQLRQDDGPIIHIGYTQRGQLQSVRGGSHTLTYQYNDTGQLTAVSYDGDTVQRSDAQPADDPAEPNSNIKLASATTRTTQPRPVNQAARRVGRRIDARATRLTESVKRQHDRLGHLSAITDPRGHTTHYGIDDFGRHVYTASPDAGVTRYGYNAAGQLQHKTRPGSRQATFSYTPDQRLKRVALADTQYHYQWQPTGDQWRSVRGPDITRTRRFDSHGRLKARVRRIDGHAFTTRYYYNDAGQRTQVQRPGGLTLRYRYDRHGHRTAIARATVPSHTTPLITQQTDTPQTQSWRGANGITTSRHEDTHGRLTTLTIGTLHRLSYDYDAGHIVGIDDQGAVKRRYRYNQAGRLDFALTPDTLYGYRYDATGNRIQTVINGHAIHFNYAPNSNRLQSIQLGRNHWHAPLKANATPVGLTAPSHTNTHIPVQTGPGGNIQQLGALHIAYTANGQPARIKRGGHPIARYRYDSQGRRIEKTVKTGTTQKTTIFLYAHGHLSAEANGQGRIQRNYVYWHGHLAAIRQHATTYAVHTNHLGAPIAVTDPNKTVVWQARYAPFGQARVNTDPDGDGTLFTLNVRLPGQYADTETGLYYNHHRYYDPATGRYISSDPMGLKAGINTYAYVHNDPIDNIDPMGLLLFAFDGTSNADTDDNVSNVVKFRNAYQADQNEVTNPRAGKFGPHWYYITGAGRDDPRSGLDAGEGQADIKNRDIADGNRTGERVLNMATDFFRYMNKVETVSARGGLQTNKLNIDTIGFSRGAAEARIFDNLLASFLNGADSFTATYGGLNDSYNFTPSNSDTRQGRVRRQLASQARDFLNKSCFSVNLRYEGLWDTVPHLGEHQKDDSIESAGSDGDAYLGIPKSMDYAAHAFSVDERRNIFDTWSIYNSPNQKINQTDDKIEKGFVGDHTDVGGAGNGDLSDVALNWIVKQGVENTTMPMPILRAKDKVVANPKVNDVVYNSPVPLTGRLYKPGRVFHYLDRGDATDVKQKNYRVPSGVSDDLDFQRSLKFIKENIYKDTTTPFVGPDGKACSYLAKKNGKFTYQKWLHDNYDLNISINNSGLVRCKK